MNLVSSKRDISKFSSRKVRSHALGLSSKRTAAANLFRFPKGANRSAVIWPTYWRQKSFMGCRDSMVLRHRSSSPSETFSSQAGIPNGRPPNVGGNLVMSVGEALPSVVRPMDVDGSSRVTDGVVTVRDARRAPFAALFFPRSAELSEVDP
jgi:hypothetical protein